MIRRHQRENKNARSNPHPPEGAPQVAREEKSSKPQGAEQQTTLSDWFNKFAHRTSEMVGKPLSFCLALVVIVIWAALGPLFDFSDTWQLVVNTATTIITFLMVFLIQNTQNRDAKAFHLKLDELIHGVKGARNKLIDLENLSDEELAELEEQFKQMSKAQRTALHSSDQNPSENK
jgi:low affinity Fe/Cu permease